MITYTESITLILLSAPVPLCDVIVGTVRLLIKLNYHRLEERRQFQLCQFVTLGPTLNRKDPNIDVRD